MSASVLKDGLFERFWRVFPEEREYRVGPAGFVLTRPEGDAVRFKPGALVWLQGVPCGADLQPTGERRRYETKVVAAREAKRDGT